MLNLDKTFCFKTQTRYAAYMKKQHNSGTLPKIILSLGDPLSSPIVTERLLRPIVHIPYEDQRKIKIMFEDSF